MSLQSRPCTARLHSPANRRVLQEGAHWPAGIRRRLEAVLRAEPSPTARMRAKLPSERMRRAFTVSASWMSSSPPIWAWRLGSSVGTRSRRDGRGCGHPVRRGHGRPSCRPGGLRASRTADVATAITRGPGPFREHQKKRCTARSVAWIAARGSVPSAPPPSRVGPPSHSLRGLRLLSGNHHSGLTEGCLIGPRPNGRASANFVVSERRAWLAAAALAPGCGLG